MGLKDSIRPLLPPTNRAFLNQTERLSNTIEQYASLTSKEQQELQSKLENRVELLVDHIQELEQDILHDRTQLEDIHRLLEGYAHQTKASLRYTNLEYAMKLPGSSADILLAGWYGAENLGDELMLRTVIESIPERSLSRICVLLWNNQDYPIDYIDPRVTVIHYPNSTWELDQLANHFSTLIWGGGAIIDERQYNSDSNNVNTGNIFIRLSKLMLARGKRVFSLALSSNNELCDETYLKELNHIICESSLFSLRDPYSKQTLESAGVNVSRIEVSEDLVFANSRLVTLPKHHRKDADEPLRIALVLLTVREHFEKYCQLLQATLESLKTMESDFEVHLIPFLNDRRGYDVRYLASLTSTVDDNRVLIEPFHIDISKLHFEDYNLVVSYKYHAALISLVQETPTLCIFDTHHPHYRNKMQHLAHLFEVDDCLYPSEEFEKDVRDIILKHIINPCRPKHCGQILKNEHSWLNRICDSILN